MSNKRPTAIVLGGETTALGVVRELGRRGVNVISIDSKINSITKYSKYCIFKNSPDFNNDPQKALNFILSLSDNYVVFPLLFPTNDKHIKFIADYHSILSKKCILTTNTPQLALKLSNKATLYRIAKNYNIRTPFTTLIKKKEDVEKVKNEITFPCIIKPIISAINRFKNGKKAIKVNSFKELKKTIESLNFTELILQEIVPGNDHGQYSSILYINKNGNIQATFNTRKIRSYPVEFGVGSLVESVKYRELNKIASKLLLYMGYRGIAEIEFKLNSNDLIPYLIEINTRTWGQNYLSEKCGLPFSYIMYCDLSGIKCKTTKNYKTGISCVSLERDLISVFNYIKSGKLTIFEYLSSLAKVRAVDIMAIDDIMPFIYYIFKMRIIRPTRSIKKHLFKILNRGSI